jgi:hypothetical protein
MSVEPAPKIFLQNKLSRCRSKLQELQPLITAKRTSLRHKYHFQCSYKRHAESDFNRLSSQLDSFTKDYTKDDIDDLVDVSYADIHKQTNSLPYHLIMISVTELPGG